MRRFSRTIGRTLRQRETMRRLYTVRNDPAVMGAVRLLVAGTQPYQSRAVATGMRRFARRMHVSARSLDQGFGKFFPRDAPRSRKAPSKESGEAAGKEAGEAGEASKEAGEAGEAGKAGKEAGEGQRGGPKEAGKAESEPSFSDEAKEAWRGLFGGAGKPGARGGKPGGPKGGPKGDPKGGAGGQPPTPRMEDIIAAAALVLLTGFFLPMGGEAATVREISWQEFKTNLLQAGEVERIVVENKQVARVILRKPGSSASSEESLSDSNWGERDPYAESRGESSSSAGADGGARSGNQREGRRQEYYFQIGSVESFERKLELAQRELGIRDSDFIPVQYVSRTSWTSELMRMAPTILMIGLILFSMRMLSGGMGGGGSGGGGGNNPFSRMFSVTRSQAKAINPEDVSVGFKDVAGCDEAKREIMEFVSFLKDPSRFTNLGAKIPRGALLVGPPGTGKTLLAKATAGEASVPFYSMSGSDFIEMFVGVGPARVRDLFRNARENSPCIVFIDEIDAVARARNKGGFGGGNDERENTLNQLLVEMDGFESNSGVVVLAGTNRSDILDPAIMRPGRFDRQILVDKPDIKGRKMIFEVHLKSLKASIDKEDLAERLAALTPGFAGAEIANICNEAAITAARKGKNEIDLIDFEEATDRVIGGLERPNAVISPQEKRTIAYHEAGHAVAGWFLEHADPLLKVTIVPRGRAGGFAQYLPKEMMLYSREQLVDRMCMTLGGRVAEEITFNRITTGAQDDLDKVTQMAYGMVTVYGMNDRIGTLSFPKKENEFQRPYSERTADAIDEEVRSLVADAYERTRTLLNVRSAELTNLAELLLEKETINQDDVVATMGKRLFDTPTTYREFIEQSWETQKERAAQAKEEAAAEDQEGEAQEREAQESQERADQGDAGQDSAEKKE